MRLYQFALFSIVILELNNKVNGSSALNPKQKSGLKSYKRRSPRYSYDERRKTSRNYNSFGEFSGDDDSLTESISGGYEEEKVVSALEQIEKKNKKSKRRRKRKRKSSSRTNESGNESRIELATTKIKASKITSSREIGKAATTPQCEHTYEKNDDNIRNSLRPILPSTFPTEKQAPKVQEPPRQPSVTNANQRRRFVDQRDVMLTYTTPWVIAFLKKCRRDALLAVPRDYLADGFNLVHLPPVIERLSGQVISDDDKNYPLYKAALRVILSNEELGDSIPPTVQRAAEALYSLVHARYITSPSGLDTVHRLLKHNKDVFGKCPNPSCGGMPLLPYGASSEYSSDRNIHAAQRYCYCCGKVWQHWDSKVDGSAWGPSFCHLYLLTFGKIIAVSRERQGILPTNPSAIPTVFGFRVHSSALKRLYEVP